MQYSIVKACLLALAATTSVVAQNAGFNVITKPTEGEVVAAGKTYQIEWIPTLPSKPVSLVVLQGASNITLQLGATIASGVPSSAGKYNWAVPADASFAVYGIKIQLDSNPEVFQYSNQFKVKAAKPETTVTVSAISSSSSAVATATVPAYPVVDDVSPEAPKTLTQYETRVQTITSCAPTVTNCPYGKVTSTIIPVMPTLSTIAVPANCSCTKGHDGKLTSTGTAPVQIPTHYPTTIVPAPYQNGTVTHAPAPSHPATTAPVVVEEPEHETPVVEQPAPETPAPVVPGPAGTAAPSEAPAPTGPVFTGAAGKVASSLTLVGAAAVAVMML